MHEGVVSSYMARNYCGVRARQRAWEGMGDWQVDGEVCLWWLESILRDWSFGRSDGLHWKFLGVNLTVKNESPLVLNPVDSIY